MVSDIKKLRPELLDKSIAELERQRTEIDLAIADKRREAEVAAKAALAKEANKHIEAATAAVKFLHEHGVLHEKLITAFTRADGVFTTGNVLKPVTAESLVGGPRKAGGAKRKRRSRAEMAAARASGEPLRSQTRKSARQ